MRAQTITTIILVYGLIVMLGTALTINPLLPQILEAGVDPAISDGEAD